MRPARTTELLHRATYCRVMARLIRTATGWMYEPPGSCPAGHTDLVQHWSPCEQCGWACIHWRCLVCSVKVRDPDHDTDRH